MWNTPGADIKRTKSQQHFLSEVLDKTSAEICHPRASYFDTYSRDSLQLR